MSAESGIRTFRDNNGLWEDHDVMTVASPQGWAADPVRWRSATAATFAASLELVKEGKAELRQSELFAPIQVRRRERGT